MATPQKNGVTFSSDSIPPGKFYENPLWHPIFQHPGDSGDLHLPAMTAYPHPLGWGHFSVVEEKVAALA